jgi:hypothetical protein
MATVAQLEKWSAEVMALVDNGWHDVDAIIKRTNRKWGTLAAIKHLCNLGVLLRYGNYLKKA